MMDREGFLEFVAGRRWRTAKSSPHQYTIRQWRPEAVGEFDEAIRHVRKHGEPGQWNRQTYIYYRLGDGVRYWDCGGEVEDVVPFNRAVEPDRDRQRRLFE